MNEFLLAGFLNEKAFFILLMIISFYFAYRSSIDSGNPVINLVLSYSFIMTFMALTWTRWGINLTIYFRKLLGGQDYFLHELVMFLSLFAICLIFITSPIMMRWVFIESAKLRNNK